MVMQAALPQIRPISDLRTRLNDIENLARESREPIIMTKNGTCLLRRFCYTVPRSTATAFHGRLPRSNAGCSDCEGRASAPLGQYGRLCS